MDIVKTFALLGIIFLILSLLFNINKRIPRIPGDIYIDKFGFGIYIPWLSSLIISVIITLFFNSYG